MDCRYLLGMLLLLLCLIGCGFKATRAASATAYGIKFVVVNPIGNSVSTLKLDNRRTGENNTQVLIGDVKILLVKTTDNEVTFKFNGDDYGTLTKGDVVQIDQMRNVTVNQVKRKKVSP